MCNTTMTDFANFERCSSVTAFRLLQRVQHTFGMAESFHIIEEKRLTVSTNQMQQNRFTKFVTFIIHGIKCPIKLHRI